MPKPLNRLLSILAAILLFASMAKGQGGSRIVYDVGLPLHIDPMADIGIQAKHYWLFDSNLSNNGPGAGCEFNFGHNNGDVTIGPKIFYQVDIFLANTDEKGGLGIYIIGRISLLRYSNPAGVDYRGAPEVGVSLFDFVTLFYGYNFPLPFGPQNRLSAVFNSRLTVMLTLHGKEKGKK